MKWVNSVQLKTFANERKSQETMPSLVRSLIRASAVNITKLDFPSGNNVTMGGWDGILTSEKATVHFPLGTSLWEFSSSSKIKDAAEKNYKKRSVEPLRFLQKDCVFVFVTPRIWKAGADWALEKRKENIWKDVIAIDAVGLEQWLEEHPAISATFAINYMNLWPDGGLQPADDFWTKWTGGKLTPALILAGREDKALKVTGVLAKPELQAVLGLSRDESIAYTIAAFMNDAKATEDFFARGLIVTNPETFKKLSVKNTPLVLIPKFDDSTSFDQAVKNGHSVIVPVAPENAVSWPNAIKLPKLNRDKFIEALVNSGYSKLQADKLSLESARSLSVLRRHLKLDRNIPNWAKADSARDIIPALFVGRWDETNTEDRKLIEKFTGLDYDTYAIKLNKWLKTEDSPFIKIANFWRLSSVLDAWFWLSPQLIKKDFDTARIVAHDVLSELSPMFELESDKRYIANLYGKRSIFSKDIKEGILQSLAIISVFNDELSFDPSVGSGTLFVDSFIRDLLNSDSEILWKTLNYNLPLIAEASPSEFLNALERKLQNNETTILSMFEEDRGLIMPQSYHAGLLRALEALAYIPEFLSRASLILAKLATKKTERKRDNKPLNSLMEIFKSWHWQTLAKYKERMLVFELVCKREPEVGWELALSIIPGHVGEMAMGTFKPRWRYANEELSSTIQTREIIGAHTKAVEVLLKTFDNSEKKMATLLNASTSLGDIDRGNILCFVRDNLANVKHKDYKVWHALKSILNRHRSFPNVDWTLKDEELDPYQELYDASEPQDVLNKNTWFFDSRTLEFKEGHERESITSEEYEEIVRKSRYEAAQNLFNHLGIEGVVQLATVVKDPLLLGDALGDIINNDSEANTILSLFQLGTPEILFAQGFLIKKVGLNDINWLFEKYKYMLDVGFSAEQIINAFIIFSPSSELWEFIDATTVELQQMYWSKVNPFFYRLKIEEKIDGINKLLKHKRLFSAIDQASYIRADLETDFIVMILNASAKEQSGDEINNSTSYHIGELFHELDKRSNISKDQIIDLEWLYLSILMSSGTDRQPNNLFKELAIDPKFFNDALKIVYLPEDKTLIENRISPLSEDQLMARSRYVHDFLDAWRIIPGVDEKGVVDPKILNKWVAEVRKLAAENSRLKFADRHIGRVFSKFPFLDKQEIWPPNEICDVIESLNSEFLNQRFSSALMYPERMIGRGYFEGGVYERKKVEHFEKLSEQHLNIHPLVSKIFSELAITYSHQAIAEDQSAEKEVLDF